MTVIHKIYTVMPGAGVPLHTVHRTEWAILLTGGAENPGDFTVVEKFNKKSEAVNRAKELAENNDRPGVGIYDKTGQTVQRFEVVNPNRIVGPAEAVGGIVAHM
jgi:hypothetical protein